MYSYKFIFDWIRFVFFILNIIIVKYVFIERLWKCSVVYILIDILLKYILKNIYILYKLIYLNIL